MNAKAIAIAQDVLEQVSHWRPSFGVYIHNKTFFNTVKMENAEQLQKNLDQYTDNCEVCALGACLLSYIRLFGSVEPIDLIYYDSKSQIVRLKFRTIHKYLTTIFPEEELCWIESAFVGRSFELKYRMDCELQMCDAMNYRKQYSSPKDVLIAIMKNIIKNEGHFIP